MRNIRLVAKHDISVTIRQRSFWILTFVLPAFMLGVQGFAAIQDFGGTTGGDAASIDESEKQSRQIGLVDEAGLIETFPPQFPQGLFIFFPDEEAALSALETGDILQYALLPSDYMQTGEVLVYDDGFLLIADGASPGLSFDGQDNAWLKSLIDYNLTGDVVLLQALDNPTPGTLVQQHALDPEPESLSDSNDYQAAVLMASVIPYIFYFLLLIGSGYLMRSVVAEKENRTVEVLLVSVNPREMMIGKMLAMGAITIIQMIVWLGGGVFVLNRGAAFFDLGQFNFPPGFIIWASLFLFLGFLLYSSVMAAAGAISNTAREAGQVTWILILPLMPTLMFGRAFIENPDSALAIFLSLFPFSAPAAMVTRLAVAEVPLWQVLLSLTGLALTTVLFVHLASRFFRPGNLLGTTPFHLRRLATGWRSR